MLVDEDGQDFACRGRRHRFRLRASFRAAFSGAGSAYILELRVLRLKLLQSLSARRRWLRSGQTGAFDDSAEVKLLNGLARLGDDEGILADPGEQHAAGRGVLTNSQVREAHRAAKRILVTQSVEDAMRHPVETV